MEFKPNRKGMAKLVTLPGLLPEIDRRTRRIAEASGDGFVPHTNPGSRRHRGAVVAASPYAARKNRKHNTLNRNLNAGR